jgi:hypothetical protein
MLLQYIECPAVQEHSASAETLNIRVDSFCLRSPIDDDYGQKNPLPALGGGVQANPPHDFFDVLDDGPDSFAQLADMLIPRLAEVHNDG